MSNTIVVESTTIGNDESSKRFIVDRKRDETLAGYVQRIRNEKGLSVSQVSFNSQNQIAGSYVSKIENGYVRNVSPEKLKALAKGLQVSEEEIFAVARGKPLKPKLHFEDEDFEALYFKHQRLTPRKRAEFKRILEMVDRELDRLEEEQRREQAAGKV